MERGDIYFITMDPALGREQNGTRPVLIISPLKFNTLTGVPVVLPITNGGNYARNMGFVVSLMGAGTRTSGVILCNQLRTLDIQARGGKRIERVPDYIIDEVMAKVAPLFD